MSVTGSVLTHVAVVWLVASREHAVVPLVSAVSAPVRHSVRTRDASIPVQSLDVVILDPSSPPTIDTPAAAFPHRPARSHSSSMSEPTGVPDAEPLPASTMLRMRDGPRVASDGSRGEQGVAQLRATDDQLDRALERSGGSAPSPNGDRLDRVEPKGRERAPDAVATVRVDPDGTAHIDSKPDVNVEFNLSPRRIVDGIRAFRADVAAWVRDPEAGKRYGRTQDLPQHLRATASCDQWADRMCDDVTQAPLDKHGDATQPVVGAGLVPIVSGTLDLTSYLARRLNREDVYAARKRKLLDATRDERIEMGARYRSDQLAMSAKRMLDNLKWLKAHAKSSAELRAGAFALWDDCAEGDGPIGEAGARARAMVLGFIRSELAPNTPAMFTPDEIARLDQRRSSTEHFVPYR